MFSFKGYLFSNIEETRLAVAGDDPLVAFTAPAVCIRPLTAFDKIHSGYHKNIPCCFVL